MWCQLSFWRKRGVFTPPHFTSTAFFLFTVGSSFVLLRGVWVIPSFYFCCSVVVMYGCAQLRDDCRMHIPNSVFLLTLVRKLNKDIYLLVGSFMCHMAVMFFAVKVEVTPPPPLSSPLLLVLLFVTANIIPSTVTYGIPAVRGGDMSLAADAYQ